MQLVKSSKKSKATKSILRIFRAGSLRQLTISGFVTMTVLLVIAMYMMSRQLELLTDNSNMMVTKTAEGVRGVGNLIEQSIAMERNARQFLVLRDSEILEVYESRKKEFQRAVSRLNELDINAEFESRLSKLVEKEAQAYKALTRIDENNPDQVIYPTILPLAYQISNLMETWINEQLNRIHIEVDEAQGFLRLQAIVLVCLAVFLSGLFTILITRPIRQIEREINRLGRASYDTPVIVHGPRDLEEVGQRLEWLRGRLVDLEQQQLFFLRHVSHELKTPLAAIREGTALLDEGVVGKLSPEQAEIISILRSNCVRLNRKR